MAVPDDAPTIDSIICKIFRIIAIARAQCLFFMDCHSHMDGNAVSATPLHYLTYSTPLEWIRVL